MKRIAFAAAAAFLAIAPAHAAVVLDGSFETPVITPGTISYGTTGSSVVYNGGAGVDVTGGAFGYTAPDGNQLAHLQVGGTAMLTLEDLLVGTEYAVTFEQAARPNYAVLLVTVSYGDTVIGSFTPGSTAFAPLTYTFTATGTSGTLTFAGAIAPGDLNAGIDAVNIAAVPEPATWGMMLLGFGMMGFGLRSRRRTARLTRA